MFLGDNEGFCLDHDGQASLGRKLKRGWIHGVAGSGGYTGSVFCFPRCLTKKSSKFTKQLDPKTTEWLSTSDMVLVLSPQKQVVGSELGMFGGRNLTLDPTLKSPADLRSSEPSGRESNPHVLTH